MTRPSGSGLAVGSGRPDEDAAQGRYMRTTILAAALEVIDHDGVERLSMRRLGDALHTYHALFGVLYGHILSELQEVFENPEETNDRLGLTRLPVREFLILRGLASELAARDGAAELELGLDILFGGLKTTLADRAELS